MAQKKQMSMTKRMDHYDSPEYSNHSEYAYTAVDKPQTVTTYHRVPMGHTKSIRTQTVDVPVSREQVAAENREMGKTAKKASR